MTETNSQRKKRMAAEFNQHRLQAEIDRQERRRAQEEFDATLDGIQAQRKINKRLITLIAAAGALCVR